MNGGKRPHRIVWLTYEQPDPASETNIRGEGVSGVIRRRVVGLLQPLVWLRNGKQYGAMRPQQPLGYTIVEVMIVLAVSGLMFVIAASFINGKQARSAFTAGVNQTASQIQDVVEQVTDGRYSDIPLDCTFTAGNTQPNNAPSGAGQGANADCVFLGKLFRFTPNSPNYELFSLAGGRSSGVTNPTLASVDPTIIDSLTAQQTISQSLNVTGIAITDSNGTVYTNKYYDFGFIQGLGVSGGGAFLSGSQPISIVYAPVLSQPVAQPDSTINGNLATAQAVTLCLSDGNPGNQLAKLVLGGSGESQLNVDIQHLNAGAPCP